MSLIVYGTVGIDTVHTPTGKAENVLGGSCMYFSAAASFHGPVRLVAAVGGDFEPKYRDVLKKFPAIDARGLEARPASKTFRWGGRYFDNMNSRETLFTELGVLLEHPTTPPPAFADSEFVFLANSHPGVQLGMLANFPRRRLVVADTMDLWINTARTDLERLLVAVDGLVLNYDEAELLTGKKNPVTAARHLLDDYGVGAPGRATRPAPRGKLTFVVVKKGEHGCLFIHRDGIAALPAFPAEQVIDPTGAGDTFAGGMMGHIAAEAAAGRLKDPASFETIQRALAHATVVASFNIESFTLSRLETLTKAELDARYAEFSRMVRV
ncbi:MAG: PfkB family carbohydrate kinase [Phycisphaerales bacterium]